MAVLVSCHAAATRADGTENYGLTPEKSIPLLVSSESTKVIHVSINGKGPDTLVLEGDERGRTEACAAIWWPVQTLG